MSQSFTTARKANPQEIVARSINPKLADIDSSRRFWFDNNPVITHMLNSLSFLFPPGEETFVRSVNHFKPQIKDPELRRNIKAFASQESMHSYLHDQLNSLITSQNPKSEAYSRRLTVFIMTIHKLVQKFAPKGSLAITSGFEHLTSIIAGYLLKREDVLAKMEPEIRNIFILHAIEEVEHKSVAFDVYQKVSGSYVLRLGGFVTASLLLLGMTSVTMAAMLLDDRRHVDARKIKSAWQELFGNAGFFSALLPAYFSYFRRSFHPNDFDDFALLQHWRERLNELTLVKIIGRAKSPENTMKTKELLAGSGALEESDLDKGVGA